MAKLQYFYTSHVGKSRKGNQDNLYCNGVFMPSVNRGTEGVKSGKVRPKELPVFAIFDGMGGEECGEMAAHLASLEMSEYTFGEDMAADLNDFCRKANRRICEYTREHRITSMGTTAAILRFTPEKAGLCNVGDSKIFLYSQGQLHQLSYDHVSISVAGRKPPLTQNLGIEETEMIIEPFVALGDYKPGDAFLICSDGLTDMVSTEQLQSILSGKRKKAAQALLDTALENGGRDNISYILIYTGKKSVFQRLKEVRLWRRN